MTHIFIVNERTFKIHLENMFAGTGYANYEPDFLTQIKSTKKADFVEKTYIEMIADISRTRIGDKVIFYVTGCMKIFGFFKVVSNPFFVSKNDDSLLNPLGKYLPLRVLLEPDQVYSQGISEHEALDDISNIEHPYQMCWSLIYRKLTGMRGCSFVTEFETDVLQKLIKKKNNGKSLYANAFSYDINSKTIVEISNHQSYLGNTNINLDITERFKEVTNSHEVHLQAYILQNFDKDPLKSLILPKEYIHTWIGNEVICSVGEQRIDILTITEAENKYFIRLIELKCCSPYQEIINNQIVWYLNWIQQYIIPNLGNKHIEIIPTIISAPFNRNCKRKTYFLDACSSFNKNKPEIKGNVKINPVEYISFRRNSKISFNKEF